jgi:short-subunit dehydrogenase
MRLASGTPLHLGNHGELDHQPGSCENGTLNWGMNPVISAGAFLEEKAAAGSRGYLVERYRFRGGTAIATGAASGIGAALSQGLAERGSHLVLVDRDESGLARVAETLRRQHPQLTVDTLVVDLADHNATYAAGGELSEKYPHTTLLINNAGVALGGTFAQVSLNEFDWLMEINFGAVVTLTHRLLPTLRAHRGAHLANVSSVLGLLALGNQTAYVASKFAIRGFTEALRQELWADGVGVTCIHPGGIATNIARSARVSEGAARDPGYVHAGPQADKLLRIPAATAAAAILRGIEHRRARVLVGSSARIPDLLARTLPGNYDRVARWIVARDNRKHAVG